MGQEVLYWKCSVPSKFTWVPLVFHVTVKYKSHSETIKYFYLLPIDTNKRNKKKQNKKDKQLHIFKKKHKNNIKLNEKSLKIKNQKLKIKSKIKN